LSGPALLEGNQQKRSGVARGGEKKGSTVEEKSAQGCEIEDYNKSEVRRLHQRGGKNQIKVPGSSSRREERASRGRREGGREKIKVRKRLSRSWRVDCGRGTFLLERGIKGGNGRRRPHSLLSRERRGDYHKSCLWSTPSFREKEAVGTIS